MYLKINIYYYLLIFCTFSVKTIKLRRYDFQRSCILLIGIFSIRYPQLFCHVADQQRSVRVFHVRKRRWTTVRTSPDARFRTVRCVRVGHAVYSLDPVTFENNHNVTVFFLSIRILKTIIRKKNRKNPEL